MSDEDRDYGVLVLGVLAAVLFLVVGWQTGLVPGNPSNQPQTVAAAPATEARDLVADTKAALAAASIAGLDRAELGVAAGDPTTVMVLTGEVDSEETKARAGEIAAAVAGVTSVDNQLTIAAPADTTPATEAAPVATEAPVAAETAAPEPPAASNALGLAASENGTVTLTGNVPTDEEKAAVGSAIASVLPPGNSLQNDLVVDAAAPSFDGGLITLSGRARPELVEALGKIPTGPAPALNMLIDGAVEPVAAPKLETDMNALFAAEPIQFASGSAKISAASNATLDKAAAMLSADAAGNVAVEGHTDNVGNPAGNQALSQARAEAVQAALVARGVDAARLSATGYGDTRPIADNATAEGRAKNRRVEVVVTG